jgi:hypothetical protein
MGYFSNGSEGNSYETAICSKCYWGNKHCAVRSAHWVHNYDECNNPNSILHILIPRDSKGNNGNCKMFIDKTKVQEVS